MSAGRHYSSERFDDAPTDQVPGRKCGAGERDILPVDRGVDQHARPVQNRPGQLLRRHHRPLRQKRFAAEDIWIQQQGQALFDRKRKCRTMFRVL